MHHVMSITDHPIRGSVARLDRRTVSWVNRCFFCFFFFFFTLFSQWYSTTISFFLSSSCSVVSIRFLTSSSKCDLHFVSLWGNGKENNKDNKSIVFPSPDVFSSSSTAETKEGLLRLNETIGWNAIEIFFLRLRLPITDRPPQSPSLSDCCLFLFLHCVDEASRTISIVISR